MTYKISFNVGISVTMFYLKILIDFLLHTFFITEMEDNIDKLWLKGLLRVTKMIIDLIFY